LLPAGSCFWLCADALAAFSPLSGCEYDQLNVSLRVTQPQQAGWLQTTPLLDALLDSLARWQRPKEWQGAYGQRLQVILDELQQCAISQQGHDELQACWQALANGQPESQQQWAQQPDAPVEGTALQQQWQLLQALRLLKGGSKPAQVASKLGYADETALQAACQQWGVGEDGDQ
jgi:AraC-like DNA-binding protein